jgi:PKD repeat protein
LKLPLILTNISLILPWILLFSVLLHTSSAYAGQATLAWDASNEPDVSGYRLHYGQASRNYTASIDVGSQTNYTITGLQEGKTYYFAATAISSAGESGFSNEASKAIPYTAPTSNFNATPLTGTVPLTISFNDTSTGTITDWRWDFGNGATSTASNALFSYDLPGTYTVSLTVTGPGGADTDTRTDYITVSPADTGTGGGGTSPPESRAWWRRTALMKTQGRP